MRILVIDNYDSFTYNLVHLIRDLAGDCEVRRNDQISLEDAGRYNKILLSPGPGVPDEAGITKEVIRAYGATASILGICLGHQAIAEVYGARLYNLENVLHGVTSRAHLSKTSCRLFHELPQSFRVTHYHSWAVAPESLPGELDVTALNEDGLVMAIQHREYDVQGLQFHPESFLTEHGRSILHNWLTPA